MDDARACCLLFSRDIVSNAVCWPEALKVLLHSWTMPLASTSTCLHLLASTWNRLETFLKSTWNISKSSWNLLEINFTCTCPSLNEELWFAWSQVLAQPGYDTHSPAAACHGRCRCLQAIHLFELATTCYNSVPILGVMAQCALSRHNRRWVMLDPVQAVRPGEGQRWSLWDVRSSQVKSGQVRSSQVKSGQVRSSQVNKIKQVHEIAKVATFALSREKLYLSNLWIDSQVMHANKQMRAFLPTKTESPWFWSWSPIIYVEVSQQLLVQSTQDFGGQMLQQLPEILLLRFIIRPIELDGHFCKCGLSCVLFF